MLRRPLLKHGLLALVVWLGGCGGEATTPPPTSAPPTSVITAPPSSVVVPPTSIVGLDDPPPVPDHIVAMGPLPDRTAPPHGCVLLSDAPQPVLAGATTADVLAVDASFLVAGYSGSPEVVALARIAPGGAPSPLGRIELGLGDADRRTAPPVLARLSEALVGIGLTDATGGVLLARFELGSPAPSIALVHVTSAGADVRYPPAIANVDAGTLVAWTEPTGTTAHVHVALVDAAGVISATHDVTPDAGTAAAPVFDAHGVLFTVDARAGISVVSRTTFGADGAPATPTVAQPLNLAAEPPAFAVVGTLLGYAAVGNGATRAVGVVTMGAVDRPQALVSGLGYGSPLTIDAVPLGAGALFAMEAPSAAEPEAPHETRVRVVGADGAIGDAITVTGMTAPRLSASSGGIVAIVGEGASVWWARCAE